MSAAGNCALRGRRTGACLLGLLVTAPIAYGQQDRTDYLSFAQGAIPVFVGGDSEARATVEHAVRATDGAVDNFTFTRLVAPEATVEFVYELPAPTTFDRFAVPNVRETPSPSQTFARQVEVYGSGESADDEFVLLASGTLATHAGAGEVTELRLVESRPVRWVKLVLGGGIDVQAERMFFEFSEIVGNGRQEAASLAESLAGGWRGRGVAMLLDQDGAVVSGCYDRTGDLEGTVDGRILRAVGVDRDDGVESAFIATVGSEGRLIGVRSTNGAPFRLFEADRTTDSAALGCRAPAPPVLGCGSIIHGIGFAYDSADLLPTSAPIIDRLYAGLAADPAGTITIEGHTSSEGSEDYNRDLSERRAAAVRDSLLALGLDADRVATAGLGEVRPIASNDDESGRSLNRRVEVHCAN